MSGVGKGIVTEFLEQATFRKAQDEDERACRSGNWHVASRMTERPSRINMNGRCTLIARAADEFFRLSALRILRRNVRDRSELPVQSGELPLLI